MRNARAFVAVALALALAGALGGCGSSSKRSQFALGQSTPPIAWPAPPDPMVRARAAGLVPESAERLQYHVHSHLDVFVSGRPVVVPAGLGIDTTNPGVHRFTTAGAPSYGGISVPCDQACISPLHTHDVTGILHTESATRADNTLGELFVEWGVRLDTRCVDTYCTPATPIAFYVDGARYSGDPRTIALRNREEIAVVVGAPPARIPVTADWSQI